MAQLSIVQRFAPVRSPCDRVAELADDAFAAGRLLECERLIAALYAYYDCDGSVFGDFRLCH